MPPWAPTCRRWRRRPGPDRHRRRPPILRHGRPGRRPTAGDHRRHVAASTAARRTTRPTRRRDTHRDHRLMHAVVLVGGFGTRLRPLTNTIPKPMLPIAHLPLIARLIGRLERGWRRPTSCWPSGSSPSRSSRRLPRRPLRRRPRRLRRRARAARHGRRDPLRRRPRRHRRHVRRRQRRRAHRPRRRRLVAAHRRRGAEATIHLIAVDDPSAFGVVEIATTDGVVVRFVEKPAPGTETEQPDQRRHLRVRAERARPDRARRRVSIERDTFPLVVAAGGCTALATDDYWIDAGRPDCTCGQPRPRHRPSRRRRRR